MRLACCGLVFSLAAARAAAALLDANDDTGVFDFCFTDDCATSLSLSLYQLTTDTIIDFSTHTVTSSNVFADLSTLIATDVNGDGVVDPVIVESPTDPSVATLYALSCLSSSCTPRVSYESEFQGLSTTREDFIGVKLEVQQTSTASQLHSPYESFDVAAGALHLNLSLALSPRADLPDTVQMLGVSFLVAATENRTPTTNVTIDSYPDGHMYLQRVYFGAGDMFMDLPLYATVHGVDTYIYIAAQAHTSGPLQDLVEITLMFGPAIATVGYESALSSKELVASGQTPAPGSTPPSTTAPPTPVTDYSTPVRDSLGNVVPTRMLTGPRGIFGLCLDSTCAADDVIALGFAGLRNEGSVEFVINRFANSPAFAFGAPTYTHWGTTEALLSSFEAAVPLSRVRPMGPRTNGEPMLFAEISHYLAIGNEANWYGDSTLNTTRGAVRAHLQMNDWPFPAPSDTLELRMAVALVRNDTNAANITSLYTVTTFSDTIVLHLEANKVLEFPRVAFSGNSVPVPVDVTITADQTGLGFIVALSLPSFTSYAYYDFVIKTVNATTTTTTNTPTTAPSAFVELDKPKRRVGSWAIAGFLLAFLALVLVVSILQCIKKSRVKIDFSKIIP